MIPEVAQIEAAESLVEASAIRNGVAEAASRNARPQADWDAVNEAFWSRWHAEVLKSHQQAARAEVRDGLA